jgi:hypothetical protein
VGGYAVHAFKPKRRRVKSRGSMGLIELVDGKAVHPTSPHHPMWYELVCLPIKKNAAEAAFFYGENRA